MALWSERSTVSSFTQKPCSHSSMGRCPDRLLTFSLMNMSTVWKPNCLRPLGTQPWSGSCVPFLNMNFPPGQTDRCQPMKILFRKDLLYEIFQGGNYIPCNIFVEHSTLQKSSHGLEESQPYKFPNFPLNGANVRTISLTVPWLHPSMLISRQQIRISRKHRKTMSLNKTLTCKLRFHRTFANEFALINSLFKEFLSPAGLVEWNITDVWEKSREFWGFFDGIM